MTCLVRASANMPVEVQEVGDMLFTYMDMTDPKKDCPSGWQPKGLSNRTCGRISGESNSYSLSV